jgi:hypothetical protein
MDRQSLQRSASASLGRGAGLDHHPLKFVSKFRTQRGHRRDLQIGS